LLREEAPRMHGRCFDEKEGCKSYLYRIRCPLFIAKTCSARAVREFGKIDL